MEILIPRQDASHFAAHAKQTLGSWDSCMAKAYCKWPTIIGIIVASVILISLLACCFRCLCCGLSFCPCGRRRSKRSTYPSAPSAFNPAPYQGYQPANNPHSLAPPQFAQFDVSRSDKVHEDSLPAMPSWDTASQKRVLEDVHHHDDVEMGKIEQKAPMLAHQAPSPTKEYTEMESGTPYQQHSAQHGGDLGNPYSSYGGPNSHTVPTSPHSYDSLGAQSNLQGSYAPYAPSVSTRYEPSSVNGSQGAYQPQLSNTQTPGILQPGRQPGSMF